MYFKQIAVQGLGCLSYAIGCPGKGVMVVVDPKRDIQDYLDIAREEGMRITHIIDTHVHADHVSGSHELRAATGAPICMYETSPVDFPFEKLKEGQVIRAGVAKLEVLHTPGHTPDSLSLLVTDTARGDEPWMLLTGDVLFVGDIGRPDLAGAEVLEAQIRNLHDSLYHKLGQLPDHLEVFPAHGMGSLCGRGMSSKTSSTLGFERRHNPMLQFPKFEDFHAQMSGQFPARPKSFTHIIATNKEGAPLLECCPMEKAMTVGQFEEWMGKGALVVDARDTSAFCGAHIPGALNIGFEKQLANWMGMVVEPKTALLLVTDGREDFDAMVTELRRIGYDAVYGYLNGGMAAWINAGLAVESLPLISVGELAKNLNRPGVVLVDVRTPAELAEGRIPGAEAVALGKILDKDHALPRDRDLVLYCGSGYRSNIAASMLQRQGYGQVRSLAGGMMAWRRAGQVTA
ncbi:MAG: rhodanese-like domain-containing protein [Desulfovibrionaceae bacterium]